MALYRSTSFKRWDGPPYDGIVWRNVYIIDQIDGPNALSDLNAFATAEMAVSYTPVSVTRLHVVNLADKTDAFSSSPGSSGALPTTGLGGPVPLFNTIRIVLTDDSGRPEQKYLRLAANVANVENGVWSGEFVTYVQENYADFLPTLGSLRGPTGDLVTAATALAPIQMRQLGWHRRVRPGFKRGWVPV
jgi:hypothetical protein